MPKRRDALDDLDFLDALEGWSVNEMARTVGRMIQGEDQVAQCLATGAELLSKRFLSEMPITTAKELQQLAGALQGVAKAIESYSGIYSWCVQQGQTGKTNADALQDLMPLLDLSEMRQLQAWLARLEAAPSR